MSRRKTSLKKIRNILKYSLEGIDSTRRIADRVGISHTQVSTFLGRLSGSDYSFEELIELDDKALSEIAYPWKDGKQQPKKPMPDFEKIDRELNRRKKNGVTRTLLWLEYIAENPSGYSLSQFNEHYRRYRSSKKCSMPQDRVPGERMFADYSGLKMSFIDPEMGEIHECELFSSALGVSGKIYVEATLSQQIPDWISSFENAFRFYGGVPALVVPDNLKSAVKTTCWYDPEINPVFDEFSDFFGTAIHPARVRRPKDKALAESAVQNIQRWIIAPLRKRTFFSLYELNAAIWEKLEVLNNRKFSVREGSRHSQFEEIDQAELGALRSERFEYADWSKPKVHPDSHIQYKYRYYSVPNVLIGKTVDARATVDGVEVFYKGKRVASHMRLKGRGKWSTHDEHMPARHLAYTKLPSTVRKWLESRTGSTLILARKIYAQEKHPACSIRRISGLMSLERKYGVEALEQACGYTLRWERFYSYRTLSNVLKLGLQKDPELLLEDDSVVEHANIRGAEYYKGEN